MFRIMIRILEKQAIRQQARPIDLRTYHWMVENGLVEKQAELIRGVIIEKMSKSPLHETTVRKIFRRVLAAADDTMMVTKEAPISIRDSEPEPDVAVILGTDDDFATAHPTTAVLAVEVAVTSEEVDREKADIYAEAGIPEFWLILALAKTIERHTAPVDGIYTERTIFHVGETLQSTVLPKLSFAIGEIFQG